MKFQWLYGSIALTALSTTIVMAQPPEGRRGGGERGERPAPPFMQALDTDKDGTLSAAEIENATKALKTLDKDGDGALSTEEIVGRRGDRGPGGGQGNFNPLERLDTDGDGKISKEEAPERMKEGFDRMDTDGDGFITGDEMRKAFEAMRGGGGGRPGQGGRGGDMADRIKQMDKDGDGKLSKEEAPERMQAGFDRIDSNSDGFIDADEMRQMFERFRNGGRGGEGGRPAEDN